MTSKNYSSWEHPICDSVVKDETDLDDFECLGCNDFQAGIFSGAKKLESCPDWSPEGV